MPSAARLPSGDQHTGSLVPIAVSGTLAPAWQAPTRSDLIPTPGLLHAPSDIAILVEVSCQMLQSEEEEADPDSHGRVGCASRATIIVARAGSA